MLKNPSFFSLSLSLSILLGVPPITASVLGQQPQHRHDRIIVKPKSVQNVAGLHAQLGNQVLRTFPRFGNMQVLKILEHANVEALVEAYEKSGLIEYAEPDYVVNLSSEKVPNDQFYNNQWNLSNTANGGIDAPKAWHFRDSAPASIVAVIDSGVRYTHEDLTLNMWRNPKEIPGNGLDDDGNGYVDDVFGINALNGSGNPLDDNGHGTHIAGIVGAVGNSGIGVAGVAWKVRIMALKFTSQYGSGSVSYVINCMNYAIEQGAHVINASWNIQEGYSQALSDAIRVAGNEGIVFVAAANNETKNIDHYPMYPACFETDNIVTVAGTTKVNLIANNSNWGLVNVDLGAPGGNGSGSEGVFSTYNYAINGYEWKYGTSQAAAHVSGTFALLKAQFPNDSYLELINRVFSSTDPLGALSGKCQTGGRLNLHKALTSVLAKPRNNDFDNAYVIAVPSGLFITATANNINADKESGEPNHAGNAGGKSIWWNFTSPITGTVAIRTLGSNFDTLLAVYTGSSVSSLSPVTSDFTNDGCSWSQVDFNATTGQMYRIAVDGYNGAFGTVKLTVDVAGPIVNRTLKFDKNFISRNRSGNQFTVQVVGPASTQVKLDAFLANSQQWQVDYAAFTLSASRTYTYTDSGASAPYRFYHAKVNTVRTGETNESCNAVGYVDLSMPSGQSMIANPLSAVDNTVASLFSTTLPDGTTLYKFDEVSDQYIINSFSFGEWAIPNMTLAPGEGAIINLPSAQTHSFVGEVMQGYLVNSIPSGYSIRSSKIPRFGPIASGLGAPVAEGDIVTRMANGAYQNYAYRNGIWIDDNGEQSAEPGFNIGESFWIYKPTDWKQSASVWP